LPSYSAFELQKNISIEDLVRNNFGSIRTERYFYRLFEEYSICINTIVPDFNAALNNSILIRGSDTEYCWVDKNRYIVHMNVNTVSNSSLRSAIEAFEYDEDTNSVSIVIYSIEGDKVDDDVHRILSKHKLIKTSRLDGKPGETPVTFAFPSHRGIDYQASSFSPLNLESIKCNYMPKVIEKVESFLEICKEAKHGIFLINGPVGTGKSYLIRSILSEISNSRRGIVCSPPIDFLTEAGLLNSVTSSFKKSIVVFEDIGELVAVDAPSRYENARSNLLNISEGLMALLMDSIFIISFNYEIDKIDPAILRPGRCLGHINVDTLPFEKAKTLVDFDIPRRSYSLAEVYEMRNTGKLIEKEKEALGFKI
jgi:hypothetical protein